MRDGGFNQVKMPVIFLLLGQLMVMEVLKMVLAFEPFLTGPAVTDLLEQEIPLGLVPVASRWFGSVITQGVVRGGPSC